MNIGQLIKQAKLKQELDQLENNDENDEIEDIQELLSQDRKLKFNQLRLKQKMSFAASQVPFYKQLQQLMQRDIDLNSDNDFRVITKLIGNEEKSQKDVGLLKKAFGNIKFFAQMHKTLHEDDYEMLMRELKILELPKYKAVFNFNELGTMYYIILKGKVSVLVPQNKQEAKIPTINESPKPRQQSVRRQSILKLQIPSIISSPKYNDQGYGGQEDNEEKTQEKIKFLYPNFQLISEVKAVSAFGDIALQNNSRRTASIVCASNCVFATLNKASYDQTVGNFYQKQFLQDVAFLKEINVLEPLTNTKVQALHQGMEKRQYKFQQVIYRQGDPCRSIYFIQEGNVQKNPNGNPKRYEVQQVLQKLNQGQGVYSIYGDQYYLSRVAVLGPKTIFGQDEFYTTPSPVRQHSAICYSQKAVIYKLPIEKFNDLLAANFECKQNLEKQLKIKFESRSKKIIQSIELDKVIQQNLAQILAMENNSIDLLKEAQTDKSLNDYIIRNPFNYESLDKLKKKFKQKGLEAVTVQSKPQEFEQDIVQIQSIIKNKSAFAYRFHEDLQLNPQKNYYAVQIKKNNIKEFEPNIDENQLQKSVKEIKEEVVEVGGNDQKMKSDADANEIQELFPLGTPGELEKSDDRQHLKDTKQFFGNDQVEVKQQKLDENENERLNQLIFEQHIQKQMDKEKFLHNILLNADQSKNKVFAENFQPITALTDQIELLYRDKVMTNEKLIIRQILQQNYTFSPQKKQEFLKDVGKMESGNLFKGHSEYTYTNEKGKSHTNFPEMSLNSSRGGVQQFFLNLEAEEKQKNQRNFLKMGKRIGVFKDNEESPNLVPSNQILNIKPDVYLDNILLSPKSLGTFSAYPYMCQNFDDNEIEDDTRDELVQINSKILSPQSNSYNSTSNSTFHQAKNIHMEKYQFDQQNKSQSQHLSNTFRSHNNTANQISFSSQHFFLPQPISSKEKPWSPQSVTRFHFQKFEQE